MIGTILGIAFGILATIVVSHYYYRKTTRKRLTPYLILKNHVFDGIDKTVRESLQFSFRGANVDDLHQLEFIIANDGDVAIRDCLEPLTLELSHTVSILDVSIVYRHPAELIVVPSQTKVFTGNPGVRFDFPLLNKGDYFVVKLLLSGKWKPSALAFRIVAEDLPRLLNTEWLAVGDTAETPPAKVDRIPVIVGACLILLAVAFSYDTFLLYDARPYIFPYPWKTFTFSFTPFLTVTVSVVGTIALAVIGGLLCFGIGMGLGKLIRRKTRFPLPEELRRRVLPFDPKYLQEFEVALQDHLAEAEKEASRQPPEQAPGTLR